jgi:hypothetical protein
MLLEIDMSKKLYHTDCYLLQKPKNLVNKIFLYKKTLIFNKFYIFIGT